MSTDDFRLTRPPKDARARELWIQHAAGFIVFQDARQYAIEQIDPQLGPTERAAALKAIDDTLYGMMMIADGDSGALANDTHAVDVRMLVRLVRREDDEVLETLDLADGDGACMGFHGWQKGDFGADPPATRPSRSRR